MLLVGEHHTLETVILTLRLIDVLCKSLMETWQMTEGLNLMLEKMSNGGNYGNWDCRIHCPHPTALNRVHHN